MEAVKVTDPLPVLVSVAVFPEVLMLATPEAGLIDQVTVDPVGKLLTE